MNSYYIPGTVIDPKNLVNQTDIHSCLHDTYVLMKVRRGSMDSKINKIYAECYMVTSAMEEIKHEGGWSVRDGGMAILNRVLRKASLRG